MKLIFILLTQSVTGAVIAIVALLIVAAIIGYFSAWFYAKSVYTPVIKSLETERDVLNNQVAGLKDDIIKLNVKVDKLNEKIGKLEELVAEKEKEIVKLNKTKK